MKPPGKPGRAFLPSLLLAGLLGLVVTIPEARADAMAPNPSTGPDQAEDGESEILPAPAVPPSRPSGEPGLGAVLVDRTITMMGKSFFRRFAQKRLESSILQSTELTIQERPSARFGSQVWVTDRGGDVLFSATLPPRISDIVDHADMAIEQVETALLQRELDRLFRDDHDLADEEL